MASEQQKPDTAQNLFRTTQFSSSPGNTAGSSSNFQTAESILSPANVAALHPLAAISDKELDYLALEDDRLNSLEGAQTVLPSRGWGDELCYGTGSTYLTGLAAGGVWGLREGLFRPIASRPGAQILNTQSAAGVGAQPKAAAASATASAQTATATAAAPLRSSVPFRLRLNTVLNSMTSRGTFVGNNAGVLALIYNGINSTIDKYRGKHDIYGSMAAGAGTGLIWRSTAGPKAMVIASGVMTALAAGWTTIKPYLV